MKKWLLSCFGRVSAREVLEDQLFEAERLALEHREAARHHSALAKMYAARASHLRGEKTVTVETQSSSRSLQVVN